MPFDRRSRLRVRPLEQVALLNVYGIDPQFTNVRRLRGRHRFQNRRPRARDRKSREHQRETRNCRAHHPSHFQASTGRRLEAIYGSGTQFAIRNPQFAIRNPHPPFPPCYSVAVPVHLVEHPLVHDALAILRDSASQPELFRRMAVRISLLLAAEATRELPTSQVMVGSPLGPAAGQRVTSDVVVVPVLRAGLGMLDAILELIPTARVGHIGLQRDELTAVASRYYSRLPQDLHASFVLMIDPMLATGGSAVAALDMLRDAGARKVRMICIVAAPEGIELVERHHPDVHIYTPVVDQGLNDHKFIVPGLGDFGDRLYGTH